MVNKDVLFSPHHQSSGLARRTAKNSFYSLAGFLWPIFLLFFRIPYFIHKLGTEQYGIWVLLISTVGMMGFLNLGIGNTLVKFISEYHAKKDLYTVNNIVGNSFFIYSMISIAVVSVGFFVLPHFIGFIGIKEPYREVGGFVLRIAVFGFVINLLMMNALAIFQALQRYDVSSKVTMATNTIQTLAMITMLHLGLGLEGMVIAYVGGMTAGLMLTLILLKRFAPEISLRPSFNIETMRKIFGFSFYSFLMGVSGTIKANVGNILVGRFLGAEFVPYLSVPLQVSRQILGAIRSLTMVLFPVFSSLKEANEIEKIKKIFIDASKLVATLGFTIGATMFIFSQSILSIWISPEFAAIANLPFRILIVSFMFALTATIPYFFLMGSGHIKVTAAVQGLSMLLTLGLGIILVPIHGIVGISISYAIATMVLTIYVYYAAKILWLRNWSTQILRIYMRAIISLVLATILFFRLATVEVNTFLYLLLYVVLFAVTLLIFNIVLDKDLFWKCLKINRSLK